LKPELAVKIMIAAGAVCALWTFLTGQFWQWPVVPAALAALFAFCQYREPKDNEPKARPPRKGQKK
jgi:hypothetical protein